MIMSSDIDKENILTAVIVTYNHQDTIERCIRSVLGQKTSYPYKLELWDDCSTDNTSQICAEYARNYPGKIEHIRQSKNTFMELHNHIFQGLARISTKYFHLIEGDDYLINDAFFQQGIECLECDNSCSMVGTQVKCLNEETNSEFISPNIDNPDIIVKIDDLGVKNIPFFMMQGRIYRKISGVELYPADVGIYLYYLTQGYCKYVNMVSAVYTFNGKGVWSEIDSRIQQKLSQSIYYRMIQCYGLKHEKIWLRCLTRHERRKIQLLSYILGRKRAWDFWFRQFMVPTFGKESLEKYWNYVRFTRKKQGEKI